MKKAYPITITQDGDFYVVYIPDFKLNTQGESIAEALEMAREVIGMACRYKEDEGQDIPEPTSLQDIITTDEKVMVQLVEVDFTEQ